MPNRSRAAGNVLDADVGDATAEKPRAPKKPRKKSKSAPRKRLRSDDDIPSILPQAAELPVDALPAVAALPIVVSNAPIAQPDVSTEPSQPRNAARGECSVEVSEASSVAEEGPLPANLRAPAKSTRSAEVADSPPTAEDRSAATGIQKNGESSMNGDIKQNVKARDTWIRLAYMILFGVVFYFGQFVVGLVAVVQFLHKLLTGAPHTRLAAFGAGLAAYYHEIVEFLSYHSERTPFPFSPWPRTATTEPEQGNGAHETAHN
jgi:Domain of unknown function (DUF4389)